MGRGAAAAAPRRAHTRLARGGRPRHGAAAGHAPARRRSGHARTRGHAQPLPLPVRVWEAPFARAARARTSRMLDALLSGRGWIALVFLLLAGIVFFNVDLLQMNRDIARNSEKISALKRENARLLLDQARLANSERIQEEAASSGWRCRRPGEVRYLKARPSEDARRAAKTDHRPDRAVRRAGDETEDDTGSTESAAGIDPVTGFPVDPATGQPVYDPVTGAPLDPATGEPLDLSGVGTGATAGGADSTATGSDHGRDRDRRDRDHRRDRHHDHRPGSAAGGLGGGPRDRRRGPLSGARHTHPPAHPPAARTRPDAEPGPARSTAGSASCSRSSWSCSASPRCAQPGSARSAPATWPTGRSRSRSRTSPSMPAAARSPTATGSSSPSPRTRSRCSPTRS